MATYGVLSCLDTFPTHMNPFDVLINKSQFQYAFPEYTDVHSGSVTVLFTVGQQKNRSKSRLLLCAHPTVDDSPGPEDRNKPIILLVSRLFLRHHDLQHKSAGAVRLFPTSFLSKVVIGAKSKHSFKWASSANFSTGLQVLASDGQTLLAREGDKLLLPYHPLFGDNWAQVQQLLLDLVVLSCSPVRQGRITASSCIVVSDLSEPPGCLSPAKPRTKLFVSDFAHFSNSLYRSSSLLANKKALTSGFSGFLQALEGRVDVRVANLLPLLKDTDFRGQDLDSTVLVSKNLLMKLGLFNHEWVVLSELKPQNSIDVSLPRGGRLASLLAMDLTPLSLELHLNDTSGLISTTHWFNLSGGETVPTANRTLRIKRWNDSSVIRGSPSFCLSASPHFASKLHVEPVRSPQYDAHHCYDRMLAHHFNTPRLVSAGDVLAISDENYTGEVESISHQRGVVLYFKVTKVFGPGDGEEEQTGLYLADKHHTSLYTGGATGSLVPFCSVGSSLWSSVSPAGLTGSVDHITSIITPHFNNRSGVALGRCNILLQGARGCGKMTSARAACRRLHLQLFEVQCVSVCGDTTAACEVKMKSVFKKAESLQPCALLLRNLQFLGPPRGGGDEDSRVQAALYQLLTSCSTRVVVIATVSRHREVSADVMAAFVHQVSIESPNEEQRGAMLASLTLGLPLGRDVSLEYLAKHTSGLVLGDLSSLLAEAGRAATTRLLQCLDLGAGQWEVDLCSSGVSLELQDVTSALERLQGCRARAVGAPKIPSVRWQEVGGLQDVKQEILNTVQLPLQRPELLSLGLHRVGLLLYGPPGTGKTLLAKAVATECSMTFLSVKGPELINMFVGQSEENIREVFSRARTAAPCVVFFDELDSLAPSRGRSGDSGGVMDRVVSQLLAELDALHSSRGVFVIGATNRPDLLDQALLRPGRFDKLVYVGINSDRESKLQVLKAITAKFHLDPDVSLEVVVDGCPSQLSGADLYALCSEAMTAAVRRKILLITDGLDTEDSPLVLSSEDFTMALKDLQPSVSEQELLKYQNIQQQLTAK
ncbi:peroxisomal ATPase PEX6 isoform X1 [Gadus chalcogrammus]|uniref:peroxisomal ATPase PEX6 isoform X1 n=1 Tax=Gadus chalcogrammus TaxID=1042646 RepID=UPI0024C2F414|nr:peroxisomal ATPase PEX6 isoform X1 [Gadus chalcogrammus]